MKDAISTFLIILLVLALSLMTVLASAEDKVSAYSGSVETQTLHFSFPERGLTWKSHQGSENNAVSLESDEYWLHASGADIKAGIEVSLSAPGALIRFSQMNTPQSDTDRKEDKDNKALSQSGTIRLEQLKIFRGNQMLPHAITTMAESRAASDENLLRDSGILQLNPAIGSGVFTLRTTQALNNDDLYLIYVREPGSTNKLRLSAHKLNMQAGEEYAFQGALIDTQSEASQFIIPGGHYQAYLLAPMGQRIAVRLKGNASSGWQISVPAKLAAVGPGELYDLYIEAEKSLHEGTLKRKAKLALSIARPTALMEDLQPVFRITRGVAANITLNVKAPGRYEARGSIYGTDKQGRLRSIMRSHSAYWLQPGLQDIELLMDTDILNNSDLRAPYKLIDFQLLDQSQLAVLYSKKEPD